MKFIFKLLLVGILIFSTIFVIKLLVDSWLYSLSLPSFFVFGSGC